MEYLLGLTLSGVFGSDGSSFVQKLDIPENLFDKASYWVLFIFASDWTQTDVAIS